MPYLTYKKAYWYTSFLSFHKSAQKPNKLLGNVVEDVKGDWYWIVGIVCLNCNCSFH